MACRQGDRDPAPSMPSVLQLPPVLREPHDEDDDVLGPHPGVSIRMWAKRERGLCVCVCVSNVCVCVCVGAHKCVLRDEARVNAVGHSPRKQ